MCVTNKGVPKELECPFFYIWGRYPGKSQTWIAENKNHISQGIYGERQKGCIV